MSEPTIPPPPISPSPFQGEPIRPARGGCPRPLLMGCLVLLILVGGGLLFGLYYISKNYGRVMAWSFERIEEGIVAQLPPDLPADERQRLDRAFAGARQAVVSQPNDPARAQRIQSEMMSISRKGQGGRLTREEVREITESLERIAGTAETGRGSPSGT